MSTPLAVAVEGATQEILRRLRERLVAEGKRFDSATSTMAERELGELVRALRAEGSRRRASVRAPDVQAFVATMRLLGECVLDAIERAEPAPRARELCFVGDWFATAAQGALENQNRQLIGMLDALPDFLILHDRDARITFLNRATAEFASPLLGLPREEVIGLSVADGPQPESHKRRILDLVARAGRGETIQEEVLLPVHDGARWHEHQFAPVFGPDGEVEAVATASRDIHARKQTEARLQLLSKVGMLAGTADMDDVLARAACLAMPELADWSIFELVEDGYLQRATVVHSDAERAALAESLLAQRPAARRIDRVELAAHLYRIGGSEDASLRGYDPALDELLRRFGATTAIVLPFVVMGSPVAVATLVFGSESNRRHGSEDLAIAEDVARRAAQIVENARLHAQLERAVEYRERVMGILGHDLRNPVSAVLSLATTMAEKTDVPAKVKEGLGHIRASAERMEQLIGTVLDFTRLRFRGAPELALDTFDLEDLARAIVDELRAAHPNRRITLDARGELSGRWDFTRIGQVISNLVENALTHGARESPVAVDLSSEDGCAVLAVTNLGPTIPSAALDKLFEPFWQGPKGSGGKSRGLGLGLYIARQIAQAHGGAIQVRSQEGQTTFTVRLPLRVEAAAHA